MEWLTEDLLITILIYLGWIVSFIGLVILVTMFFKGSKYDEPEIDEYYDEGKK